ncbi:MAG TPA: type II secretion system F family protein [Mycobacteriales bacterium]|nr:type II secretion system F family protein [Mycobacteriales bacterium]
MLGGGLLGGVVLGWPLGVAGGALGAAMLLGWRRRRTAARATERTRIAVADLAHAVAADLRCGSTPAAALVAAAASGPLADAVRSLAGSAARERDIARGLDVLAERPGARGLRALALCWSVTAQTGASLAGTLERVAGVLDEENRAWERVDAALAGARATGWILALLPLFGLVLAGSLGGHPVHLLLHSPLGGALLALAAVLDLLGVRWLSRLARTAVHG